MTIRQLVLPPARFPLDNAASARWAGARAGSPPWGPGCRIQTVYLVRNPDEPVSLAR
ncbi:hypothetical protein ABTY53_08580 [Streptomyces noursei]|uniref:hypothetical protein n=1 Tax=Streptomyces noursei TaxID=1971 RepID=UPI00332D9553